MADPPSRPTAVRGPVLTFTGDPFRDGLEATMVHEPDAIVAMADGRITQFGPAERIARELPPGTEIRDFGKDALISAGFIDSHVHFPQTPMIAAYGAQLLDWLNKYTFPAELKFADKEYRPRRRPHLPAREPAQRHHHELRLLHRPSAFGRRAVRGGREARPAAGRRQGADGPQRTGGTARHAAIGLRRVEGPDRQMARPRPAALCHHAALRRHRVRRSNSRRPARCGASIADCLMQTHIAENRDEVAWIRELFPDRRGYLDVYDHHGLCGQRAVFGHGIWLEEAELQRLPCQRRRDRPLPDLQLLPGQRRLRPGRGRSKASGRCASGWAPISAPARRSRSWPRWARPTRRPSSTARRCRPATPIISPPAAGARAMYLDDRIGSIAPGMEADLVVLDMRSTPLIDFRMNHARGLYRAALHPDDPGRRPRRAGDLCGGPVGLPAALFRSGMNSLSNLLSSAKRGRGFEPMDPFP